MTKPTWSLPWVNINKVLWDCHCFWYSKRKILWFAVKMQLLLLLLHISNLDFTSNNNNTNTVVKNVELLFFYLAKCHVFIHKTSESNPNENNNRSGKGIPMQQSIFAQSWYRTLNQGTKSCQDISLWQEEDSHFDWPWDRLCHHFSGDLSVSFDYRLNKHEEKREGRS